MKQFMKQMVEGQKQIAEGQKQLADILASQGSGGLPRKPNRDGCHNCGSPSHWIRDCPQPRAPRGPPLNQPQRQNQSSYRNQQRGAYYPPQPNPGNSQAGYHNQPPNLSYPQQNFGHQQPMYTQPPPPPNNIPAAQPFIHGMICDNCFGEGHKERQCQNPRAPRPPQRQFLSGVWCDRCKFEGHVRKYCPNPRRPLSSQ